MHKKKWVFLVAYFFIAISIQPITSNLENEFTEFNENTSARATFVWNGIVDLDNDYSIASNDILTIEACTEINLNQNIRIIVEGRLIIEGTTLCPVIMNNQGSGDHEGISFQPISKNKGSEINNLTIKNSDYGITIFSSNPTLNNIKIENADKVGIDIYDGATPTFENIIIEQGGQDEHGGFSSNWRYGIGISVGNFSAPIFDNVIINGTLTRGFNFWGNSGGLFSNVQISNVTGSTLAAATCVWIMDAIPYFENINLSRCDNGIWVRQYDDSIQTNAVIRNAIIEDSRFYGVIVDKTDHSNYSNYVMATFEGLEISGTGGENSNGFEFSEGIAAIEVNVSGAIFEDVNLHDNPVPGLVGYLVDDTLFVRNMNITNCGKIGAYGHDAGIYIRAAFDNGPPELVNVNVSNSPGSGIFIERGATNGYNWNLYNNSEYGLLVDHATVRTNWINSVENGKSGVYVFDSSNIILQNLTSDSNGYSASNNKDGSGIVFDLSNNVESNGRNVSCINCTSTNDFFGGVYIENSIDLYLDSLYVLNPQNDGYGLYVDNSGLSQVGHINIDGALFELNRSGEIVKINAAANINNLEINGNIDNGNWGMIWDGSSAMDKSLFTNSEIKSNNCIKFLDSDINGEQIICDGNIELLNSNVNISKFTAKNRENVSIIFNDGNSLLHLHKPINLDLKNLTSIISGSKIEEAYDLDIWVLNQFNNRLPFANIDVNFANFNDDYSITTDYLGHVLMADYVVREWTSSGTNSVDEEVDLACTYDNTTNNTGIQTFSEDMTLYCNLTLSNQAPIINWISPLENEIFPSRGIVEFDAHNSWDLDNDALTYSWFSDIDGDLLESGSQCISSLMADNNSAFVANHEIQTANGAQSLECLSDGVHEITLEVCDDENACSYESRTITLTNLPAVVNMNINPKADGDGVLRIPRSTIVQFNASGTYDPEGEDLTILLTDTYDTQVGQVPDQNLSWSLSFVDSPEDTVTVTITFDDGIIGNLVIWSLDIILFNELPQVDFIIDRENNYSNSLVTLDGSSSLDPEGDEITLEWISDIDGLLYNGTGTDSLIWDGWLSSGIHEIKLKITDSKHQWEWVEKSMIVNVENSPPVAIIGTPDGGNYLSSDYISFIANGSGDWDSSCESLNEQWKIGVDWLCNQNLPNIKSDLLSINWKSNLDGDLSLNHENNLSGWYGRLSAGSHIITLEIDDGINLAVSTSISLTINSSAPVIVIDSPNLENDYYSDESILFDLRRSIDYDGDEFTLSLEGNSEFLVSNTGIKMENVSHTEIYFIDFPNGIYELNITLTDSNGMSSIKILVLNILSSNPIASITSSIAHYESNSNTFTFEPGDLVTLSGENSVDADNDILSYEWSVQTNSGSWEKIQTENGGMEINYNLSPGAYIFKLKVTDMLGGTGERIVNVIVESSRPSLEDLTAHPNNFLVNENSELRITVKLDDADNTTKNVSAVIILASQNWSLELNDNGKNGDATENDGIWTGVLTWVPGSEGFASVRVTATDTDLRYDEEVLDIKIGSGDFSIIDFFGGGANVAIGGFILALLISLGLALMIRKRTLNSIDLDEYIESWDSLTIQNEKEKPLISDDELDI